MTPEKELLQKIIKILAQYPSFENVPAGEWNRIEAIIQQAKSEWEKASYGQGWIDGVSSIKNSRLNAPEP